MIRIKEIIKKIKQRFWYIVNNNTFTGSNFPSNPGAV